MKNKFTILASTFIIASSISYSANAANSVKTAQEAVEWGNYNEAYSIYESLLNNDTTKNKAAVALEYAELKLSVSDFTGAKSIAKEGLNYSADAKTKGKLKKLIKKIADKTSPHKIGGGVSLQFSSNSNIGAAPAAPLGAAGEDDDEDSMDLDDLEEAFDDVNLDDDDLEELENLDADGDNIPDDEDDDVNDTGEDAFYSKGRDSDVKTTTKAQIGYSYIFTPQGDEWKSGVVVSGARLDDREELNKDTMAFTTGPVFNFPKYRLKINPSYSYLNANKEEVSLMDSNIWALGAKFQATPALELQAKYSLIFVDFEKSASPDSRGQSVKFSAGYDITEDDSIEFAITPKFDNSKIKKKDKNSVGYSFGYQHKFPYKISAGFKAALNDVSSINLDPEREDVTSRLGISVAKKFDYGFSVSLAAEDSRKDSNKDGKNNNNQAVILTTGWTF